MVVSLKISTFCMRCLGALFGSHFIIDKHSSAKLRTVVIEYTRCLRFQRTDIVPDREDFVKTVIKLIKYHAECLWGQYVVMTEKNKHKKWCFIVPGYLFSLTIIKEQMEEAVSWVVRPLQAGSRWWWMAGNFPEWSPCAETMLRWIDVSVISGISSNNSFFLQVDKRPRSGPLALWNLEKADNHLLTLEAKFLTER